MTANNYTVFFDVNGGNALNETDRTKRVTFVSTYGDLPTPNRTGHTFIGWLDNGTNTTITQDTIVNITDNQTLVAQWVEVETRVRICGNCVWCEKLDKRINKRSN